MKTLQIPTASEETEYTKRVLDVAQKRAAREAEDDRLDLRKALSKHLLNAQNMGAFFMLKNLMENVVLRLVENQQADPDAPPDKKGEFAADLARSRLFIGHMVHSYTKNPSMVELKFDFPSEFGGDGMRYDEPHRDMAIAMFKEMGIPYRKIDDYTFTVSPADVKQAIQNIVSIDPDYQTERQAAVEKLWKARGSIAAQGASR